MLIYNIKQTNKSFLNIHLKFMKRWPSWYYTLWFLPLAKHNIMHLLMQSSLLSYCWIESYEYMLPNNILSHFTLFPFFYPSLLYLLSPFISYSFTYSASAYFLKRLSTHTCDLNHSYTIILELYCVCRRMLVFYRRLERAKTIYI